MSSALQNLWPTDLAPTVERTPLTILKEQAAQLGTMTKNLLEGRVETATTGSGRAVRFSHAFNIAAPSLGYTYQLLILQHSLELYPISVAFYGSTSAPPKGQRLASEAEFLDYLRKVFASDETRRIIGALLAQVQS
jgi:hypothetical protein